MPGKFPPLFYSICSECFNYTKGDIERVNYFRTYGVTTLTPEICLNNIYKFSISLTKDTLCLYDNHKLDKAYYFLREIVENDSLKSTHILNTIKYTFLLWLLVVMWHFKYHL
jgi:hypothetical protein